MSGFKIVKLGYSRNPWRIINAEGDAIRFETEAVYMHGQDMTIPVYGYLTKAAAVEALGRLAATLWDRLETPPKSGAT